MEKVLENVYLVDTFSYAEKGTISAYVVDFEKAAIIDPGAANGAKILLEELEKAGIKDKVEYLMNTHIHIDHAGGSSILVKHLNAKVVVHPKGVKHIVNPEKLWQASKVVLKELADTYGKPEPVSEDKIIAVEDGQRFDLGGDTIVCYHAPGHAPHMVVYYLENSKVLFSSDSVGCYFDGMVFPTTPPPFSYEDALKSLERMMELDVKYVAFTHFGIAKGKDILKKAYDKIVMWCEVAREVAKSGGDVKEFMKRIVEVDKEVEKFTKMNKSVAYGFLEISAMGMLDYARKK